MIAVTPASLTGTPVTHLTAAPLFRVRLISRQTGRTHHINGTPLHLSTHAPDRAAEDLLRNRDPRLWEVQIEPSYGVIHG